MQNLWQGIVEDNNDPLKLYRCKVRIFGIHTENKSDETQNSYLSVDNLPWALTLNNGSGMDEEGSFNEISNGSMVIISFLDEEKQKPIIIGTLPRIVKDLPNFSAGFSDPDKFHPQISHLGESSISRLARNENIIQTIIQTKRDEVKNNVECNSTLWSEPESQYDAEYPKNKVIQTRHHVFEMDDTEGKERIHIYHKSGSSKEYHPNGDLVNIIKNKKFSIILSDDNILIEGNQNIRILGSQNISIIGDENRKIEGDQNISVDGDENRNISGSQNISVIGDETIECLNQTISIDGSQNIIAETSISLTSPVISLNGAVSISDGITVSGGSGASAIMTGDVEMAGDVNLTGNINGSGDIDVTGSLTDGTGNTNHHVH